MLSEGSLHVHGAQLNDAGRYYCTVSNQAGSDHRGMDLRVFGKCHKYFISDFCVFFSIILSANLMLYSY